MELRNLRTILYKTKWNLEIQLKRNVDSFEEEEEEEKVLYAVA